MIKTIEVPRKTRVGRIKAAQKPTLCSSSVVAMLESEPTLMHHA